MGGIRGEGFSPHTCPSLCEVLFCAWCIALASALPDKGVLMLTIEPHAIRECLCGTPNPVLVRMPTTARTTLTYLAHTHPGYPSAINFD